MKYLILSLLLLITITNHINGQSTLGQASNYQDPAQALQKIMMQKSERGSLQLIGNYKVLGSSYLYGGNQVGDVYFKNGNVKNVLVTYDTYRQLLEINIGKGDKSLIKTLNELDSFTINAGEKPDQPELKFVSVTQFDSSKKLFLLRVVMGSRFNLYKSYTSELGYVSDNYIQSELRQFDLNYMYYYTDNLKPGLKKLKASVSAIKKEFKDVKDVSSVVKQDDYNLNPELALIKVFSQLNN